MTIRLLLIFYVLFYISGCNTSKKSEANFNITIQHSKPSYSPKDLVTFVINNSKNRKIDSITYFIDQQKIETIAQNLDLSFSLKEQKLGNRMLHATVYFEKQTENVSTTLYILAEELPKLYTYKIVNTYPHDIEAFTQGLEFHGDTLYESTGQYGKSTLRKTHYKTGEVIKKVDLDPNLFGEGITILNSKIYQLTWRERIGIIYNLETMEKTGSFVYSKSEEGWGLCNDGTTIYKSDGTEKIWTLNKNNLHEESFIEIYTNTSRVKSVNELEWVNGKIYANIFQQNAIAIINPKNGAVDGVIDLSDLQEKVKQHQYLDVLNGIAYKGDENRLFVTGKNWDKLFEIEIIEKQ